MAKKARSGDLGLIGFAMRQADLSSANLDGIRITLHADDLALVQHSLGQANAHGTTMNGVGPMIHSELPALQYNIGQARAPGMALDGNQIDLRADELAMARYDAGHLLASGGTSDHIRANPRADDLTADYNIGHIRSGGTTSDGARFTMLGIDDFTIVDNDSAQADANSAQIVGGGPAKLVNFVSALGAGDIAVVGYNTGQTDANGTTVDSIQIVLTKDVASGTVIFMTDRTWNGSAFSVSGADGTTTYTFASNTVAGTVINVPLNGGFDPDQNGEAIYIYQGAINAPTSFMYAIEIADGNTTFNASLANTGLTVGTSAVGIALDSATYSGPTTEAFAHIYNGKSLLQNISDATNWVGDDADGQKALDQPDLTGPIGLSADFSMWSAAGGGGGGIIGTYGDATANGGNSGIDMVQLFTNLQVSGVNLLFAPQDIVFDTVHGKFFIADSDITGGHNRILQGNISDLLGNPAAAPPLTVLYSDTGTTAQSRIFNLQVDPNHGIVYFDHGQTLAKVVYNTANQAVTQLANFGTASGNPNGTTNNFIDDFVINFATGDVYLSSHRIVAAQDGDQVSRNYIYKITGLDSDRRIERLHLRRRQHHRSAVQPRRRRFHQRHHLRRRRGLSAGEGHGRGTGAQPGRPHPLHRRRQNALRRQWRWRLPWRRQSRHHRSDPDPRRRLRLCADRQCQRRLHQFLRADR